MIVRHTPGPWAKGDNQGNYVNEVNAASPRGSKIVIARIPAAKVGQLAAKNNARLIAAAPDLLEALQMLMHFAPNSMVENDQYTLGVWADAAAAIAKATGEAAP